MGQNLDALNALANALNRNNDFGQNQCRVDAERLEVDCDLEQDPLDDYGSGGEVSANSLRIKLDSSGQIKVSVGMTGVVQDDAIDGERIDYGTIQDAVSGRGDVTGIDVDPGRIEIYGKLDAGVHLTPQEILENPRDAANHILDRVGSAKGEFMNYEVNPINELVEDLAQEEEEENSCNFEEVDNAIAIVDEQASIVEGVISELETAKGIIDDFENYPPEIADSPIRKIKKAGELLDEALGLLQNHDITPCDDL